MKFESFLVVKQVDGLLRADAVLQSAVIRKFEFCDENRIGLRRSAMGCSMGFEVAGNYLAIRTPDRHNRWSVGVSAVVV